MKKLLWIMIAAVLAVQATVFAEFADVPADTNYYSPVERLAAYGVISGIGDGKFAPDSFVTRAQMARIAVVMADCENGADSAGLFLDTPEGYWANGSINAAAKNNLLYGYPDGMFHPEAVISFAESTTIILRLLGYGTKELGNHYPDAYLNKAQDLGITADILLGAEDAVDRKTLCIMLDHALMCDINNNSTRKNKLISNLDLTVSDECIVLSTYAENKEILHDEAITSIGTYKYRNVDLEKYVTGTVKLVINLDNEIVAVLPVEKEHRRLVIKNVTGNTIAYQENGTGGTLQCQQDNLFYYQSARTSFGSVKEILAAGDVLDVYKKNGAFEYAVVTRYELKGPEIVYQDTDRYVYGDHPRVVRDGEEADISQIQKYDVLYYDTALDTVYAYCDKASGVYEEAIPNKADVKQIVLSGKTYTLETQEAVRALNSSASAYKFQTYITCLLGRDGQVAGVIRDKSDVKSNFGLLLSCEERTVDGTKNYYATFLSAEGTENEFKTNKNYDEWRGRMFRYEFQDGIMTPKLLSGSNRISGALDKVKNTIGGYSLAEDGVVIDRVFAPELKNDPDAEAKVIQLSEISQVQINEANVLHYELDKNGQIAFIVFDNITMSGYQFGIIKSVTKMSSASTFEIDLGGKTETYNTELISNLSKGQPVMAMIRDNQLKSIYSLVKLNDSSNIEKFTKEIVTINGREYPLYKNAVFYVRDENMQYNITAFDDLNIKNIRSISLYGDKRLQYGGLVRIVKIEMKDN